MLDDEDFEFITECYDLRMNGVYVYCSIKSKFKRMGLYSGSLQKLLMCPEKKGRNVVVDHKDGNECNNQKDNLRVCSHQENLRNQKITKFLMGEKTTSIYKGVSWRRDLFVWQANIHIKKNYKEPLGLYKTEVAAANCYNYFAIKHFGEFARLNDCPYMEYEEWMSLKACKNKSSKYKGVSFVDGKWLAQICNNSKNYRIGSFEIEIDAAKAYNEEAIKIRGSKARINKFDDEEELI